MSSSKPPLSPRQSFIIAVVVSSAIATSLATTAAIAVAEHEHGDSQIIQCRVPDSVPVMEDVPASQDLEATLDRLLEVETHMRGIEELDLEEMRALRAGYQRWLDASDHARYPGVTAWAKRRVADVDQLFVDIEEMKELERQALLLEAAEE